MKTLFKILIWAGVIGIIGTAGSSELTRIDFLTALKQLVFYIVLLGSGTYGIINIPVTRKKTKIVRIRTKNVA